MKNVVTLDEIRDVELRPENIFQQYMALLQKDISIYFSKNETGERSTCPACISSNFQDIFIKLNFQYRKCQNCGTLFVKEVLTDKQLHDYFDNSKSYRFFVKDYIGKDDKQHIQFLRRLNWICDSLVEFNSPKKSYMDLRTKYESFLVQAKKESVFEKIYTYNSFFKPQIPGVSYIKLLKEIPENSISVLSAFDYLDGIFKPEVFIKNIYRILSPDGLFFLTTRCSSGFDMQILGQHSKSIRPPSHVSIFSIEGLITFFESNGFTIKELSTPGQLDIDIVSRELKLNNQLEIPQFIQYFLQNRDSNCFQSFKEFLQKNRLSSYTRILVQKTN